MSKQYRKESLGRVDGSISSDEIFTPPHSPEQEQNLQRLLEQLRPFFMQGIQQTINLAIEENNEIREGDIIQIIYNYVNYYITNITNIVGQIYVGGPGIRISGATISVRDGKGLVASGDLDIELDTDPGLEFDADTAAGKLRAKCKKAAAIDKDSSGIKAVLSANVLTDSGGAGGGLQFDATSPGSGVSGMQVAPEDFLIISADDLP